MKSGTIPTNPGAEKPALYSLISILPTLQHVPISSRLRAETYFLSHEISLAGFGIAIRRSRGSKVGASLSSQRHHLHVRRHAEAQEVWRIAWISCPQYLEGRANALPQASAKFQADNACALNSTVRESSSEYRKAGHNRHGDCRRRDTVRSVQ